MINFNMFENISNLVVKEVDGSGGYGMLIGPKSSKTEIDIFKTNYQLIPTVILLNLY